MGKNMMKRCLCLAAVGAVLMAGPAVGRAMAYFTANAEARGNVTLNMNFTEIIPDEKIIGRVKHISIRNTGDVDCYVRVKVFAGEKYESFLSYEEGSAKWMKNEDGYFYYSDIVMPQGSTDDDSPLLVKLEMLEKEALENGLEDFNVIVVAECTAVLYHEDGSPYADWDADTGWNASVEQKPETAEE